MTKLIIDGSNISLIGLKEKRNIKTLGGLLPCLRALLLNDIDCQVIFDASFQYRVDPKSDAATQLKMLRDKDDYVTTAPAGTSADEFILELATLKKFGILSNDAFRDRLEKNGRRRLFNGQPVTLHQVMMLEGYILIPSLHIRYLIDPDELDVRQLIVERSARANNASAAPSVPKESHARSSSPAVTPSKVVRVPSAKQGLSGPSHRQSATPAASSAPVAAAQAKLNDMLALSPFFLRSDDVFEMYRRLAGKPWKSPRAKKTAQEFADECFKRPVRFVQPEGREKNSGYFFDLDYNDERHEAVRSYLLVNCSKVLCLIGSDRKLLGSLLQLVQDMSVESAFDLAKLRISSESRGLPFYDRYLRALLYVLVAADGLDLANPSETDISTILKGEVRSDPTYRKSDLLNLFQRGILYLAADSDNQLPELILDNADWMLRLPPRDEHMRKVIMKGHLTWLADDH